MGEKIPCIFSADRSAVDDADGIGNANAEDFSQYLADIDGAPRCVVRRIELGARHRRDRPNWFIGDDNAPQHPARNILQSGCNLLSKYWRHGFLRFARFLPNGNNRDEAGVESCPYFPVDHFIHFAEQTATLRMAEEYIAHTEVLQHRRGYLTSISARILPKDILTGEPERTATAAECQVRKRRCDCDLNPADAGDF